MTEQAPDVPREDDEFPAPGGIPGWIPVLIGATLVILAALAVYTGIRYRDTSLVGIVSEKKAAAPQRGNAPPGAPGAGASLILPGTGGDNTPTAGAPVSGSSRAVITGGRDSIQSVVRIWAQRGVVFNVLPEDSTIFVNGLPIGQARQFNTIDEAYEFAAAGSYTVTISANGFREKQYVVTSAEDAKLEVARISVQLEPE